MLETFRLIAIAANLANPLSAPPDNYILDTGLTAEDCAQGIRGGLQSVQMETGLTVPLPNAILYCEPEESSDAPQFIPTGPHTFKTSWGESSIYMNGGDDESSVPRKTVKRKRKAK